MAPALSLGLAGLAGGCHAAGVGAAGGTAISCEQARPPAQYQTRAAAVKAAAGAFLAAPPPPLRALVSRGTILDQQAQLARRDVSGYVLEIAFEGVNHLLGLRVSNATRQIIGHELEPARELPSADIRRAPVTIGLPFRTTWWVQSGGPSAARNVHADTVDQRLALDLTMWRDGGTYAGDGSRLDQYWVWNQPVTSPADGTVVEVVSGEPDLLPAAAGRSSHPAGNYVLLDLGQGTYALLAHFRKDSVTVRAGQRVAKGQLLGACGSSGRATEPHLHVHLQDRPYLFRDARALAPVFEPYCRNGTTEASGAEPTAGDFISPRPK